VRLRLVGLEEAQTKVSSCNCVGRKLAGDAYPVCKEVRSLAVPEQGELKLLLTETDQTNTTQHKLQFVSGAIYQKPGNGVGMEMDPDPPPCG